MKELYLLSQKISSSFKLKKLTLSIAESCTGGLVSSLITDTPGASSYFILGVVAYSNTQKQKLLKIPPSTLRKYSSVSSGVVKLMAKNIRKIAKTDIGVGLTGYAGPGGGTSKNLKGTVYIALSFRSKIVVKRYLFKGSRIAIKKKAAYQALKLIALAVSV